MLSEFSPELLWYVVVAGIVAFFLAFGVGANDVANSFGTSVGAGVLTIRRAFILATIFEIAGACLIGYSVSSTVRKDIANIEEYNNYEKELILGFTAALFGSAIWNLLATWFKMPISGTHSIIGAICGFTIVSRGWHSVNWMSIAKIGKWHRDQKFFCYLLIVTIVIVCFVISCILVHITYPVRHCVEFNISGNQKVYFTICKFPLRPIEFIS